MSAVFSDAEESLGTGMDRQVNKLSDLEEMMNSFRRDIPSLKRQAERFKTEVASLKTEILALKSERDSLRIEVNFEHAQNTHLHEISLIDQSNDQGRLNRRIWVLEQENQDLKRDMESSKVTRKEELEKEVGISNGLRDRIGTLDDKRGKALKRLEEAEGREMRLKGELEALRIRSRVDIERLEREVQEARLAVTTVESQSRVQVVAAEEQVVINSPRRALQKRPSNFAHPVTPTKTQATPSHPPSSKRKRATSLSPASLSKRCTMVEERYNTLKGEYDKLRGKYQDDIKHWKEWKAADMARKEEKRKKKEIKKSTPKEEADKIEQEGNHLKEAQAMETVTLVPPSQESASASQGGSQRVTRSQAKKRKVDERSDCEDRKEVAETIFPPQVNMPSLNSDRMPEEPELLSPRKESFIPPPPSQKRRITRTPVAPPPLPAARSETPTPHHLTPQMNTSRKRVRVTPWLGGSSTRPLARTSSKPMLADTDQDPFDDNDHEGGISPMKAVDLSTSLIPGVKGPLIRDRGEGPTSSLRRTLLARNVSTTDADRSRRESASPAPSVGSVDSPLKRALDMSDLTPQQVAKERKRISKMTPAEKKVLYADYKGKGRYLRPDEVKTTVADEFEIDPKQNNGLNYQYHDVQRGRAERKLMHGGDCECCNGYYEAVGPLPKYNAGPAWKDASQVEGDMTEAQVKEHQNKVSRHRETWVRPPTPPGYWQIGFPNTQDVEEQNRRADAMAAEKEAKIRREAAHRDSKWKKKN